MPIRLQVGWEVILHDHGIVKLATILEVERGAFGDTYFIEDEDGKKGTIYFGEWKMTRATYLKVILRDKPEYVSEEQLAWLNEVEG